MPVPVPPWTTVALARGSPPPSIVVEPADPGRDALGGRDLLDGDGIRAAHPREEREPVGADLEEVAAGDVARAAQLQDLDLADRGQLVTPIGEAG